MNFYSEECLGDTTFMTKKEEMEENSFSNAFFQIFWKSRCNILVSFPSQIRDTYERRP